MPAITLDAEFLVALVASIVAIVFEWIPGVSAWFEGLSTTEKKLFMAGATLLTTFGVWGLGCLNVLDVSVACSTEGIEQIVWLWLIAISSNQTVHLLTRDSSRDVAFG